MNHSEHCAVSFSDACPEMMRFVHGRVDDARWMSARDANAPLMAEYAGIEEVDGAPLDR